MCHGSLVDHAASLLKAELDKPQASKLLAVVEPDLAVPVSELTPRQPWVNQPDCLTCHSDFEAPSAYNAFNTWAGTDEQPLFRDRTGVMGLRCPACHGSPHALYPAKNSTEEHRDNLQPLRTTGLPFPIGSEGSCSTCHTITWPMAPHHPNMVRPFRGAERREWLSEGEGP